MLADVSHAERIPPGPGQESVWDYPRPPRVEAVSSHIVVELGGVVIADTHAAVRYPTAVLVGAGVPPVERDEFTERRFPEDVYDLAPATFADLDPSLHEPGLTWGAAKAHVHLARRRREGRR